MKKTVIAGGTGFLGRSIVRKLALRGDSVVVLARSPEAARATFGGAATPLLWSLEDPAARRRWEAELDGASVVNLAGAGVMDAAWTRERKEELRRSRVDVTSALAEGMARARDPGAFVSASAVGYYGASTGDGWLREESPPGTDFLAEVCVEWEAAAEAARAKGVRVVHPRLGIVLGSEGGALKEMARPFKLHAGGPLGSGKQWVSWVHEQDVVLLVLRAIDDAAMSGAYNFVAPEPVTNRAVSEAIAHALHTHARLPAPAFAIKALLGSERATAILGGQRCSAERLMDAGYSFRFTDVGAAMQDLLGRPS